MVLSDAVALNWFAVVALLELDDAVRFCDAVELNRLLLVSLLDGTGPVMLCSGEALDSLTLVSLLHFGMPVGCSVEPSRAPSVPLVHFDDPVVLCNTVAFNRLSLVLSIHCALPLVLNQPVVLCSAEALARTPEVALESVELLTSVVAFPGVVLLPDSEAAGGESSAPKKGCTLSDMTLLLGEGEEWLEGRGSVSLVNVWFLSLLM